MNLIIFTLMSKNAMKYLPMKVEWNETNLKFNYRCIIMQLVGRKSASESTCIPSYQLLAGFSKMC